MIDHRIITDYCTVRPNIAKVNGCRVFESSPAKFSSFSTALYKSLSIDYPKFHKMDSLCRLGFVSTELLLNTPDKRRLYSGNNTGIILMNSSSSIDADRTHQTSILNRSEYFPSPSVFVYTLPNIVIGEICIRNKITGEGSMFISERFDPVFLVTYLNHLFDCEIINRCIAGWVEINGENYESLVCLVEKSAEPIGGIANFEATAIDEIYTNNR